MQKSAVFCAVALAGLSACGASVSGDPIPLNGGTVGMGHGGASESGGAPAGGTPAAGGTDSAGGAPGSGGSTAGGAMSGGGSKSAGGTTSASGGKAAGGSSAAGGTKASGGTSARGGAPAAGGTTASGGGSVDAGGSATTTIPGMGCTPPAAYANLFVSLSGHTQAETDAKIAAAWTQMFTPSNANTVYYDGPGADESYVKDVANNDVRTEGQSYGMMIAVQLDHQTQFDRLWTFAKKHMAQSNGQFAWHTSTSGSVLAAGGAPDGDEYFAAALIFASKRWGDAGKYNYANEAKPVLDMIRTQDFNQSAKLVQFYVGSGNTDGSYILPAFYQTWACFDTANAAFWNSAVTAGRAFFKAAVDSNMVIGDQSSFSGGTVKAAGSDTLRCVMNIMMDHNFFRADPWQETYAAKYGAYISSRANTTAAVACNGLLGFGMPASSGKAFVDKLWSTAIPTGNYRYYDGTLYMLALLQVSGTFRLWY